MAQSYKQVSSYLISTFLRAGSVSDAALRRILREFIAELNQALAKLLRDQSLDRDDMIDRLGIERTT
ncbi:hypothetical protein [Paracoccus mutanolyticus]|uniref:hypothetical protein n=1 Tax=Paracoccus mutanolyticus TaxID=1499308 RepID=UPI0011AEA9BC|nr:hypothetical protein [Paracoccus mutanolyticus]